MLWIIYDVAIGIHILIMCAMEMKNQRLKCVRSRARCRHDDCFFFHVQGRKLCVHCGFRLLENGVAECVLRRRKDFKMNTKAAWVVRRRRLRERQRG